LLALVAAVITVVVAPARDEREARNMTLLEAAALGTVEGLTEFLPVSSTGHLLVAQRAMQIGTAGETSKRAADAFAICIQLGAILAILGLYAGRVGSMTRGLLGRDDDGRRLVARLALAFLPAAVLGLTLGGLIQRFLFGPWPVVVAWAVGGGTILAVAWSRRGAAAARGGASLEDLTARLAFGIGLAQCIAMWPGVSRSLVTIVGGVLGGLSLAAAVEFSFLLGVVTLGAATGYDAVQNGHALLEAYSLPSLVVGLAFAFVSAVLAVRWLVGYLHAHGLALFGWYRVVVALLVAALLWAGRI